MTGPAADGANPAGIRTHATGTTRYFVEPVGG